MTKLLLYLAIAFILWRVIRVWTRGAGSRGELRRSAPRERVSNRRADPVDYGRVRDARYRDLEQSDRADASDEP